MPMKLVHEVLVKAGRLEGHQGKEEKTKDQEQCFCQYHGSTMDHSIQECPDFLEFCGNVEEQNMSVLLKEEASKPLTIYY